jgi:hypothetical protein
VQKEGRCRYYRLANDDVAHALEALGAIAIADRPTRALSPERAAFRAARTCYDHLAGALSVSLARRLEREGIVRSANSRAYEVTDRGAHWLAEEMGIDVASVARERRVLARRCIDGTEQRPHVGGALGAAMLERMLTLRWVAKISGSRALRTTARGQEALSRLVGTAGATQPRSEEEGLDHFVGAVHAKLVAGEEAIEAINPRRPSTGSLGPQRRP